MSSTPESPAGRKAIDDQVVVVVGASSGIGRTTVRQLTERGASVIAAARSAEDLASLVEECRGSPGIVHDVVADVMDVADMRATAAAAVDHFGRIDTWVGVAGVGLYGRAWETAPEEYDTVMRTNWLGQVHGALAALPELRRTGGTLICIGSVESVRAVPLHAAYVSSKMALRGFCDSLRMDLDADQAGVAVSLVLPAAIDTPFFAHARSHLLGGRPKPPPPVYTPESVAEVILQMAEHPRREVVVGGSGLGFLAGQLLAPGLTDRLMTFRNSMLRAQQGSEPPHTADNLDSPVTGSGTETGGHDGRRSLTSAVLGSAGTLARPVAGVGAAAAGVAANAAPLTKRAAGVGAAAASVAASARPLAKRAAGVGAAAAGVAANRLVAQSRRDDQEPSEEATGLPGVPKTAGTDPESLPPMDQDLAARRDQTEQPQPGTAEQQPDTPGRSTTPGDTPDPMQ